MTDDIRLGSVWLPYCNIPVAPREIRFVFWDVNGTLHVRWCYPGFPDTGAAITATSWRRWVRYQNAREVRA